MPSFFLSYARRDSKTADALLRTLELLGHEVWIDRTRIPGGQNWWREICLNIRELDYFVVLVTPNSAASKMCAAEVQYALHLGKDVLPVQAGRDGVAGETLKEIGNLQAIDYSPRDPDGVVRLVTSIARLTSPNQSPVTLVEDPPNPALALGKRWAISPWLPESPLEIALYYALLVVYLLFFCLPVAFGSALTWTILLGLFGIQGDFYAMPGSLLTMGALMYLGRLHLQFAAERLHEIFIRRANAKQTSRAA